MKDFKIGSTFIEWLVVLVILCIVGGCIFGFASKHIFGNRQIIDFNHQTFNVAYVLSDNGKWERIDIKAWKDWHQSDSVQIIKMDGKAIYTHLQNVKLCCE